MLILIAAASLAGAFAVQLAHTQKADAATIGFCGNVQLGPMNGSGGQSWCQVGLISSVYQAYAWGEHSVCVNIAPWSVRACSSGTNGVYSGQLVGGPNEWGYPTLENNTNTNNYSSGVYFTH
jgi:hypothetical protein